MKILQSIQEETRKIFDMLGGENLLDSPDAVLQENHLTRGFDWPETARELDPEKVKSFISEREKIAYEEGKREMKEEIIKEVEGMKMNDASSPGSLVTLEVKKGFNIILSVVVEKIKNKK